MLARQVAPGADLQRERIVAGRALDQHAEAGIGKAGAGIPGDRVGHVPVAARDQHVGYYLAQRLALGDGGEMLLGFAVGIGDEIAVVEPLRLGEHRPRHFDIVVERQHPHHAVRRIGHAGKPDRQLGARLGFDRRCKLGDDLVEQVDLTVRIAMGIGHEQVGDPRQHLDALRVGAGRERAFEFVEEGRRGRHG